MDKEGGMKEEVRLCDTVTGECLWDTQQHQASMLEADVMLFGSTVYPGACNKCQITGNKVP